MADADDVTDWLLDALFNLYDWATDLTARHQARLAKQPLLNSRVRHLCVRKEWHEPWTRAILYLIYGPRHWREAFAIYGDIISRQDTCSPI